MPAGLLYAASSAPHDAFGRVAEWFKATVLKTVDGETYPWVRIPPLPPGTPPRSPRKAPKNR